MKTNVYVDAFNLYFGALKGTPHRWLDLQALCGRLLPGHKINRIRYCTALVRARAEDPGQPVRQQIYLRALRTLPTVTIHYGHFLSHEVEMPLAADPTQKVRVLKTEEKGSDVNLASYLLLDASLGEFDLALVISNDSDLLAPIKLARYRLKRKVGVVNPHIGGHPSRQLMENATFFRSLRRSVLGKCQFPAVMRDKNGTFHKPKSW